MKEKLVQAYQSGKLFDFIDEVYYQDSRQENQLPYLLAEFHNSGELNLIEIFRGFENTTGKHNFFSIRRAFEEVLPALDAPVVEVADCVKHLTLEAGKDLAAYTTLPPFREFCQKDSNRTKELFDFALSNIDEEFDHLSTAIEAGIKLNEKGYVDQAVGLLETDNLTIKKRVIFALGRVNYSDKSLLEAIAVDIVNSSGQSPTDIILATAMRALFSIVTQSGQLESIFLDFLTSHSENFGEHYIHAASETLFYDAEKVSSDVEPRLLEICLHTKPENKGTIDNIDYALERILKRDELITCIEFLEQHFEISEYNSSIKQFDSFSREIHNHRDTHLSSLLTRWLSSKNIRLGRYCYDLLRESDGGTSIGFDISKLSDENDSVYLFLARKACGWFFTQPKTAISLIESLIPSIPEDDLIHIRELIFNPLCISYPGSIRERLEELQDSLEEKTASTAKNVLEDYNKYHDAVNSAFDINELKPSEQDRHTYWKHHNKLMEKSMKEARSKSFLSSLFSESVLLYGNKSIHYIHHGENKTRQELPLHEYSHSIEFASMHNIDPHRLDNMLWQFKAEGCRS